jgi:hypothetical protein
MNRTDYLKAYVVSLLSDDSLSGSWDPMHITRTVKNMLASDLPDVLADVAAMGAQGFMHKLADTIGTDGIRGTIEKMMDQYRRGLKNQQRARAAKSG